MGSGESAIVSRDAIFFITSGGSVMRRPVAASLIMERSVGSVLVVELLAVVRRRDLSAVFGRLANILIRLVPYLARRTARACFRRSLNARRRPWKKDWTAWGGVISPCGWRSSRVRSPRVSKARSRGERVVRSCRGVVTQLQRGIVASRMDVSPDEFLGVVASIRTSRRTAFARRRISATSCRTELGQMWRGRVPLIGGGTALWGNMVVAVSTAFPSISWRVIASSRMCVLVSCEVSMLPSREMAPDGYSNESLSERAVDLASIMAV